MPRVRRRRQPGRQPAGPSGGRTERRPPQHRRHRQLGRRGLLRPRGQHQDPPRRTRRRRSADRTPTQRPARVHDRGGRRTGAAHQLRPERVARQRAPPGAGHDRRARTPHGLARGPGHPRPGAGVAAHPQPTRAARQGRARAHLTRARGARGLRQAGPERRLAGLRPARRALVRARAGRLLPGRAAPLRRGGGPAPPAPRDHRQPHRELTGQPWRDHVRAPGDGGDRRVPRRGGQGVRGRPGGVRPAGVRARCRGPRRPGAHGRPERPLPRVPSAARAGRVAPVGAQAGAGTDGRGDRPLLRRGRPPTC